VSNTSILPLDELIKEKERSTQIANWPKPICQRCNKEIDKMTIKFEVNSQTYKVEVECHLGYEMYIDLMRYFLRALLSLREAKPLREIKLPEVENT